jgi:hypothetical protein
MKWHSFQVKDTEIGMDGEQLKKLFDEFSIPLKNSEALVWGLPLADIFAE